jgi:hypothetical protein
MTDTKAEALTVYKSFFSNVVDTGNAWTDPMQVAHDAHDDIALQKSCRRLYLLLVPPMQDKSFGDPGGRGRFAGGMFTRSRVKRNSEPAHPPPSALRFD